MVVLHRGEVPGGAGGRGVRRVVGCGRQQAGRGALRRARQQADVDLRGPDCNRVKRMHAGWRGARDRPGRAPQRSPARRTCPHARKTGTAALAQRRTLQVGQGLRVLRTRSERPVAAPARMPERCDVDQTHASCAVLVLCPGTRGVLQATSSPINQSIDQSSVGARTVCAHACMKRAHCMRAPASTSSAMPPYFLSRQGLQKLWPAGGGGGAHSCQGQWSTHTPERTRPQPGVWENTLLRDRAVHQSLQWTDDSRGLAPPLRLAAAQSAAGLPRAHAPPLVAAEAAPAAAACSPQGVEEFGSTACLPPPVAAAAAAAVSVLPCTVPLLPPVLTAWRRDGLQHDVLAQAAGKLLEGLLLLAGLHTQRSRSKKEANRNDVK